MSIEKFNPGDAKRIEDLPEDQQQNFVESGEGFVRKEVADYEEGMKSTESKIAGVFSKKKADKMVMENIHEDALNESENMDNAAEKAEKEKQIMEKDPNDPERVSLETVKSLWIAEVICERAKHGSVPDLILETSMSRAVPIVSSKVFEASREGMTKEEIAEKFKEAFAIAGDVLKQIPAPTSAEAAARVASKSFDSLNDGETKSEIESRFGKSIELADKSFKEHRHNFDKGDFRSNQQVKLDSYIETTIKIFESLK